MIEFDELVNKGVRIEFECLRRIGQHRRQKRSARHVCVLRHPCLEPGGDSARLRHPADAGWMFHDAFALGNGELAQQEKPFARRRGDPVWIAAAGIQESALRRLRRLPGQLDQLILDLEGAQCCEILKCQKVGHGGISLVEKRRMITIPKMVSAVFPLRRGFHMPRAGKLWLPAPIQGRKLLCALLRRETGSLDEI